MPGFEREKQCAFRRPKAVAARAARREPVTNEQRQMSKYPSINDERVRQLTVRRTRRGTAHGQINSFNQHVAGSIFAISASPVPQTGYEFNSWLRPAAKNSRIEFGNPPKVDFAGTEEAASRWRGRLRPE